LVAYGRSWTILSCAFLNRAAATIFMAEVICLVDLTELILDRIAFRLAIAIRWYNLLFSFFLSLRQQYGQKLMISPRQTVRF
jgi:hypothetical protein